MLNAKIKQTPKGDKYHIEESLKKPKTDNISQVIMVGLLFLHEINQSFSKFILDAIASSSSYPCQSVVGDNFRFANYIKGSPPPQKKTNKQTNTVLS